MSVNTFENANHPPMIKVDETRNIMIRLGEEIQLDASESSDPDGDSSTYHWFIYKEAGTYWACDWYHPLTISNPKAPVTTIKIGGRKALEKSHSTHLRSLTVGNLH